MIIRINPEPGLSLYTGVRMTFGGDEYVWLVETPTTYYDDPDALKFFYTYRLMFGMRSIISHGVVTWLGTL